MCCGLSVHGNYYPLGAFLDDTEPGNLGRKAKPQGVPSGVLHCESEITNLGHLESKRIAGFRLKLVHHVAAAVDSIGSADHTSTHRVGIVGKHLVVGGSKEQFLEPIVGKALSSEIRNNQGGNSAHVRASHRSSLHQTVLAFRQGAHHLETLGVVSAGSNYISPVTVAGVVGTRVVGSYRSHGNNGFIVSRVGIRHVVVTCCEDYHASLHGRIRLLIPLVIASGVLDEIIYSLLKRIGYCGILQVLKLVAGNLSVIIVVVVISPAILGDDCTVVGRPFDGIRGIGPKAFLGRIGREYLAGHKAHSGHSPFSIASGYSANSDGVVVYCSDSTGHVSAMVVGVYGST